MSSPDHPVTLCGCRLSGALHVCAFFDSRDEQYQILNPFFREGLDGGEEVVTIVESAFSEEHTRRMRAGGVPVDAATAAGQLKLLTSEQTYAQGQVFVAERMCGLIEETVQSAERSPYGRVRAYGDMEWALQNLPGTDELMMYEARVNALVLRYDCTLLCGYDVNRFSGRVMADTLATHPHVILGGRVVENPYFVEPVRFLQKVALRRSSPTPLKAGSEADA